TSWTCCTTCRSATASAIASWSSRTWSANEKRPAEAGLSQGTAGGSAHVQAAVDREVRAGRVAALLARKPGDDGGDLARLAQALHRDRRDDLVQHVLADGLDHVGADVARAHGVDRHALVRELLRQRHREAVHARLGRGVVGLAGLALLAVDR